MGPTASDNLWTALGIWPTATAERVLRNTVLSGAVQRELNQLEDSEQQQQRHTQECSDRALAQVLQDDDDEQEAQ
eukprot:COSAG06_NODE_45172_length_357_cov_0.600775_1_plen_74_part_10